MKSAPVSLRASSATFLGATLTAAFLTFGGQALLEPDSGGTKSLRPDVVAASVNQDIAAGGAMTTPLTSAFTVAGGGAGGELR